MITYTLGRLNTEMHGKSVSVKNRNGLELYRLVNQSVDALPTNAKFYLDCQLLMFAKENPELKNPKDPYLCFTGFRFKDRRRRSSPQQRS